MTWRKKNWLVELIRNVLRIICLFIFIHWFAWITTYANCTNYRDSINKSIEQKTSHDEEIEYSHKFCKREKKKIGKIEDDILKWIEDKKNVSNLPREWKINQLNNLQEEIDQLTKKENPSKEEREKLAEIKKKYEGELESAKKKTINNIQEQLEKHDLTISEFNDGRGWWESFRKDPLNFFFISPVNKVSKKLGLENYFWVEIIFKLIIFKLIYLLVIYPELTMAFFRETSEKLQNPYLSIEEKEQIQREISPLTKHFFFNGAMWVLFTFIITFFHPSLLDRTSPQFYKSARLFIWIPFLIMSSILSIISQEFSQKGRILNVNEIKTHLAKHWVMIFISSPLLNILFALNFGNSYGFYSLSFLSGLVEFSFNLIKVLFFRKGVKQKFKADSKPVSFKSGIEFKRKY